MPRIKRRRSEEIDGGVQPSPALVKAEHTQNDEEAVVEEDVDALTESVARAPESYDLPEYWPLLRKAKMELRTLPSLRDAKYNNLLTKYLEHVNYAASGYADATVELKMEELANKQISKSQFDTQRADIYTQDETIVSIRDSMKKYRDCGDQLHSFTQALAAMKAVSVSRLDPEVTMLNIDEYQHSEQKNPYDLLVWNMDHPDSIQSDVVDSGPSADAKAYKQFERQLFVTINPTEPLPNIDEDEDVAISGGTVSLNCPISGETMKDPVKSSVCGHTYDKESMVHYLRNSNECPVCGVRVRRTDLVPDLLMQLRLKCYARDLQMIDELKIDTEEVEGRL